MYCRLCGGFLLSLMIFLTACSPSPTNQTEPVVTISSPSIGAKFLPTETVGVQSSSVDPEGIAKVSLVVNGEVIRIDENVNPQPNAPFIVVQPWQPTGEGLFELKVRVEDTGYVVTESDVVAVEITTDQAILAATPTETATMPPHTPTPPAATTTSTNSPPPVIQPTVTRTPTGDANNLQPTSLPVPNIGEPTATYTPVILNLPEPTATPTIGRFQSTGFNPDGQFRDIWEVLGGPQSRLGYPLGGELEARNFAYQPFESGEMYWLDVPDGPDAIWVMDGYGSDRSSGTRWNRYDDTWNAQLDTYSCPEAAQNRAGPVRGFGKVWCDYIELQVRLGWPYGDEAGSGGVPPFSRVQFYQGGVMLYDPLQRQVLVLFDQGDWQRFGY